MQMMAANSKESNQTATLGTVPQSDPGLHCLPNLSVQNIRIITVTGVLILQVNIFKPCTSKGGNSEVYVVCKKFKGVNDPHYLKAVSAVYFGE